MGRYYRNGLSYYLNHSCTDGMCSRTRGELNMMNRPTIIFLWRRGMVTQCYDDDGPNFGFSGRASYAMGMNKPNYPVPARTFHFTGDEIDPPNSVLSHGDKISMWWQVGSPTVMWFRRNEL